MKRFILVGGYPDKAPDGGRSMWQAVAGTHKSKLKVLDCFFARIEEYWEITMARDWAMTQVYLSKMNVELTLARPELFIKQLKACDVVYFHGGNTNRLKAVLDSIPDWQKHLAGKTIVGSSAGAEIIGTSYLDIDNANKYEKGYDLLPVKVLCHYKSSYGGLKDDDWIRIAKSLEGYDTGSPILALREGEFVVIEDDKA